MTMAHTGREVPLNTGVAAEIRAWMGRNEKTQAEMARLLGENEMWVYRRIRGKQQMTLADLQRIATALGVSVLDLLPAQASRPTGRAGGGLSQTIVRVEPDLRPRTGSHVATRTGPLSHGRRDTTRPVSAIPANLRRPSPTRPPARSTPRREP